MIRKAFRMAVLSGHESAYEQRHSPIWRELADGITAHGAHRYSILLDESDGSLFGYVEVEDEARWAAIAATPVCRRWWTHMSGIMPVNDDDSPCSVPLREVFRRSLRRTADVLAEIRFLNSSIRECEPCVALQY